MAVSGSRLRAAGEMLRSALLGSLEGHAELVGSGVLARDDRDVPWVAAPMTATPQYAGATLWVVSRSAADSYFSIARRCRASCMEGAAVAGGPFPQCCGVPIRRRRGRPAGSCCCSAAPAARHCPIGPTPGFAPVRSACDTADSRSGCSWSHGCGRTAHPG